MNLEEHLEGLLGRSRENDSHFLGSQIMNPNNKCSGPMLGTCCLQDFTG